MHAVGLHRRARYHSPLHVTFLPQFVYSLPSPYFPRAWFHCLLFVPLHCSTQFRRLSTASTGTDVTARSAAYRRDRVSAFEALTKTVPIVQIYGACETVDTFCVEMELMEERDLFDRLSQDGVFSEVRG